MNKNLLYRSIPKVDIILEYEAIRASITKYGRDIVVDAIRVEMDELRKFIGTCDSEEVAKEANVCVNRIQQHKATFLRMFKRLPCTIKLEELLKG